MSTCQWTCRGCNASTYTPLRTPLQAQRCSSCLLWGSGNVTAQNSVGVSSESNLRRSEVKKRENCWEKQSDKQVTRPICFVGGENHKHQTTPWERDSNKKWGQNSGEEKWRSLTCASLNKCWPDVITKLMMSTWGLESAKATNNDLLYGEPNTLLTCNKRCSIQGDERVWAVLQVSHYMFHHSVHCLDQSADHRGGLLLENNDPTRKSWQLIHCFWFCCLSRRVLLTV